MSNVFKKLNRLSNSINRQLNDVEKDSEKEDRLVDARSLLDELITYRDSYEWMYKLKSKERMKVFIESGCDYNTVADVFGIEYNAVKSMVHWGSEKFKSKVGENTLDLIGQGLIEEARAAFYISSGKIRVENLLCDEFIKYMPQAKFAIYNLKDCEKELKVLRAVSKVRINKMGKGIDLNKLAYLRYLIEGHSKYSEVYRPFVLGILDGNYDLEDVIENEDYMKEQIKAIKIS